MFRPKSRRIAIAAFLLSVTAHAAPPATPHLDRFDVFSLGDLDLSNAVIEGVAGAGRVATLNHSTVGRSAPQSLVSLSTGGDLRLDGDCSVRRGVLVGGEVVLSPDACSVSILERSDDADSARTDLAASEALALSDHLASLKPSARATWAKLDEDELILKASRPSGEEIFEIDADDLDRAAIVLLNGTSRNSILVNVRGTGSFDLSQFRSLIRIRSTFKLRGSLQAANVTFHFPDARRIVLDLPAVKNTRFSAVRGFIGSVVAPRAKLTFASGCLRGGVVAGEISGGGRVNLPANECPALPRAE